MRWETETDSKDSFERRVWQFTSNPHENIFEAPYVSRLVTLDNTPQRFYDPDYKTGDRKLYELSTELYCKNLDSQNFPTEIAKFIGHALVVRINGVPQILNDPVLQQVPISGAANIPLSALYVVYGEDICVEVTGLNSKKFVWVNFERERVIGE